MRRRYARPKEGFMHKSAAKNKPHIQQDFRSKNIILSRFGKQISPIEYLERIFPDDFIVCGPWGVSVIPHAEKEMVFSLPHADQIFTPYCTFFQNFYSKRTAKQLLCLTVDIEHVTPLQLEALLKHMFALKGFIKPTYVVNSGRGIHFVYQLQEPLELFDHVKPAVKKMLMALCSRIKKQFGQWRLEIDYPASCDFAHAFRAPGTMTKIGEVATVFYTGEPVSVKRLASFLKIKIETSKPRDRRYTTKQKRGVFVAETDNNKNLSVLPRGNKGFYHHCFMALNIDHKSENRYLALFGLAVVGWKCRIPREEVLYDLKLLQGMWNEYAIQHGLPIIRDNEIEKAMKGYSPKYTLVKAETLGEWMNIRFNKNKRNYRKRKEHLEWVAETKRKNTAQKIVQVLLSAQRYGTPLTIMEIAEQTNLSRQTIYNRLKDLHITPEQIRKGTYKIPEEYLQDAPQNIEQSNYAVEQRSGDGNVNLIGLIPPYEVSTSVQSLQTKKKETEKLKKKQKKKRKAVEKLRKKQKKKQKKRK
jgi:hypothetical protein